MTLTSQIFAYDLRAPPQAFVAARWDEPTRAQYLLRPSTRYPLSVATRVWPSIPAAPDAFLSTLPDGLVPEQTAWYYKTFGLWRDLGDMRRALALQTEAGCGIAIGLVSPDLYPGPSNADTDAWLGALLSGSCVPVSPAPTWRRLGYDVADKLSISALTDCASASPGEREAERARWGGRLNAFGLFDAVSDACAFCLHAGERFPEHAPFLVFELLLLWGMEWLDLSCEAPGQST